MSDISGRDVEITDEHLMALADGELRGDALERVSAYVSASPEGAQRFAVFLTTGRRLSGMFAQPMHEPVPQRLIDAVMRAEAPASNVISMDRARKSASAAQSRAPGRMWVQAAAACVALVAVGIGAKTLLTSGTSDPEGAFALAQTNSGIRVAGGVLAAALDVTPSGTSAVRAISGSDATIKPVFTFAAERGGFCRQYIIQRGAGASSFEGVACRAADGQWQIEVHEELAPTVTKNSQIVVAGKEGPATVEAVVDRLISGNVLGVDEEAALVNGGWSAAKP